MTIWNDVYQYFGGVPATPVQATPAQALQGAPAQAPVGQGTQQPAQGTAATATQYAQRQGSNYAPAATCAVCPATSVKFKLGWTFYPTGVPQGTYHMIPGMPAPQAIPADGNIALDQASGHSIPAGTSRARLVIALTSGPTYNFDVTFDLPAIHEPTGLKRRLTNLGLYAGIDEYFGGRALWAVRAFKRIHMNGYQRNQTVPEDDRVDGTNPLSIAANVMAEVQTAYGVHPDDNVAALTIPDAMVHRQATTIPNAGMFGGQVLARSSYETAGASDDQDPRPGSQAAVWAGTANPSMNATRAGYEICLAVYDETKNEPPLPNHLNLPQPVHMLQFALFETGYWVVAGARANARTISRFGPGAVVGTTNTANGVFASLDGGYGRNTHWAVREFQCHAKMERAAVEDVTVTEPLYLQRLTGLPPETTRRPARYPLDGRVSGSVNEDTARALQDWLDRRYRCPVLIYASPSRTSLDLATCAAENIWRYDDWNTTAPRMYAIDLSNYYTIPAAHGGNIQLGSHTIARPITVGGFTTSGVGSGPVSLRGHVWTGADSAEVTPQNMMGIGGITGAGLSGPQLSTFKVVRVASHYECLGHLDAINAYDDVCISFGPCHWTLARTSGGRANEPREMGAMFSHARAHHAAAYDEAIGRFGMFPGTTWPIALDPNSGTYASTVQMQTETGTVTLCGVANSLDENQYARSWHWFYRMQMACRTIEGFKATMWDFARLRISDMLDKQFVVNGVDRRLGDFATSEKAVAMLHRWHIFRPVHVYSSSSANNNNFVNGIISTAVATGLTGQALETYMIAQLSAIGGGRTSGHLAEIAGMTNVPQVGTVASYSLNLTNPALSSTVNSFQQL